ncbi:MAG: hypothetical protein HYR74_10270 [Candidatus Eisenbacteria bacterium]|nr:hypothetical protein [Candidatus Eisenbacteria bacterium]
MIENLKIGHTYSLSTLANLPLSVTSSDASPLRVRIEPLIPDSSELRRGAEAAPDLRWASAVPETLTLAPNQTGTTDLRLAIPDDRNLLGRRFQIVFWTHTLARAEDMLAYGLKSRIIFSIAATADSDQAQPSGDLSVSLEPGEVKLHDLAPGHVYPLEQVTTRPFTVRNTAGHRITVTLAAMSVASSGSTLAKGDGELLDAAQVRLEPASMVLEPGEQRAIAGTISMSGGKSLKGRNLMCIISAAVTDQPVRTQIYTRIYTHVR